MFNIKFMLLFGEIPTNRCFYFRNYFAIESDLSKSYVNEKAELFSIYNLIARAYVATLKNVVSSEVEGHEKKEKVRFR